MSDPLAADELQRRWQRTLGPSGDWERADPLATQKPAEPDGTLSQLSTVGATLSGGLTHGGSLSGGTTASGGTGAPGNGPAAAGDAISAVSAGYELVGELGRGGMGVVYRARQRALAREIALKFIRPEQAGPVTRERFVAEALVNGLLDHPNIVPVHELGTTGAGEVYLAMKLVDGRSWKDLLHPRTAADRAAAAGYDLDRHLTVLQGVANAIAFAHARGIVHRDLKPENVMVGGFGEVLVMDWGIAVDIRDQPGADQRAQHKSTITTPSGTPSYMAPELAEGRGPDIGPWTDVYLLGAILHEVLTGAPPHRGRTLMEVLLAASRALPPVYPPEIPAGLAAIARKALARGIAERHQSVAELQAELAAYVKHRESEVIAAHARTRLAAALAMPAADSAARNRRYAAFAEAVAGFRQALVLWTGNADAQAGEHAARLDYARAALAAGDLGLAEAQLEPLPAGDAADGLRAAIAAARAAATAATRAARRNRLLLASAVVVIVAGLATGVVLVKAEQAATATQRDRAVDNERKADAQRRVAEEAQGAAEKSQRAAEESQHAARAALVTALRQRGNDDRLGAAATWDAEALRAAAGDPAMEALQRRRLGPRLAAMPVITAVRCLDVTTDSGVDGRVATPDARVALLRTTGPGDGSQVRLWDLRRLEPLGMPFADPGGNDRTGWSLNADGTRVLRHHQDLVQALAPDGTAQGAPTPRQQDLEPVLEFPAPAPDAPASVLVKVPGKPVVEVPLAGVKRDDARYAPGDSGPDVSQALTAGADGKVTLWRLPAGQPVASYVLDQPPAEVVWGKRLLLLRDGQAVHLCNRAGGAEVGTIPLPLADLHDVADGGRGTVERCVFFADGQRLAIERLIQHGIDRRYLLDLYDLHPDGTGAPSLDHQLRGQDIPGPLTWILETAGGGLRLFCQPETFEIGGVQHNHLLVLDCTLPEPRKTPILAGADALAVNPAASVVVVVADGRVHRLRGSDRSPLAPPVALGASTRARLAVSGDGLRYATAIAGTITVHAVVDGAAIGASWRCPPDGYLTAEDLQNPNPIYHLSQDGKRVVALADTSTVRWYEPDTGRQGRVEKVDAATGDLLVLEDHRVVRPWLADDRPVQLAFPPLTGFTLADVSRDGRWLLTVTGHNQTPCHARLFDLASGALHLPALPFRMFPTSAAFSPDGRRFAVGIENLGGQLFSTADGTPAAPPMDQWSTADRILFSADGATLVLHAGAASGASSWWDAASGQRLDDTVSDGDGALTTGDDVPCFLPDGALLGRDGALTRLPEAQGGAEALALTAALHCGWRVGPAGAAVHLLPHEYVEVFDRLRAH